jgi:hypothetical protein
MTRERAKTIGWGELHFNGFQIAYEVFEDGRVGHRYSFKDDEVAADLVSASVRDMIYTNIIRHFESVMSGRSGTA